MIQIPVESFQESVLIYLKYQIPVSNLKVENHVNFAGISYHAEHPPTHPSTIP
jgi:hypothetical protein